MLSRRLVLALVLPVVAYFLVTSLSCELDAKDPKKTAGPQKMADSRKCCTPGYLFCPTGEKGCKCCGVSVKGTLVSYEKKEGKLTINGLTDEDDGSKLEVIPFHVEKKEVDDALATMKEGTPGTFILKLKLYEYELPSPSKDNPIKHWHGRRFECESVGDKGNMKDKTAQFIEGWRTSSTIDKVRTKLEEIVPAYDPERDEDKRP